MIHESNTIQYYCYWKWHIGRTVVNTNDPDPILTTKHYGFRNESNRGETRRIQRRLLNDAHYSKGSVNVPSLEQL